ncbi:MAG: glutathione S-transferase [Cellvibrionales bacterium]|nr:glutathione S-transferase [Cellvibrionales bacterium]
MSTLNTQVILYSFRRCPYAMRARLAILFSGLSVELREILLKDKPKAMLAASPKGTVPVLINGSQVIDESLDIMFWALNQRDPEGVWQPLTDDEQCLAHQLITQCDNDFKPLLDGYKYALKEQSKDKQACFEGATKILIQWNALLTMHPYLLGRSPSLADLAIFPFIRQFRNVDISCFKALPIQALDHWLDRWLASDAFLSIMHKWAVWDEAALEGGELFPAL